MGEEVVIALEERQDKRSQMRSWGVARVSREPKSDEVKQGWSKAKEGQAPPEETQLFRRRASLEGSGAKTVGVAGRGGAVVGGAKLNRGRQGQREEMSRALG